MLLAELAAYATSTVDNLPNASSTRFASNSTEAADAASIAADQPRSPAKNRPAPLRILSFSVSLIASPSLSMSLVTPSAVGRSKLSFSSPLRVAQRARVENKCLVDFLERDSVS